VADSLKGATDMADSTTIRFWRKVHKTPGCWEWTGKLSHGYGRIGGPNQTYFYAHRISWELHNGPIPEGLYICHICDNPCCVRPDHLFLGTAKDNGVDMASKQRAAFQQHPDSSPKGEAHGMVKLTDALVREIRDLCAQGIRPPELAQRFGVDVSNIRLIVRRKTWKHI
jgi:hypothetical protein